MILLLGIKVMGIKNKRKYKGKWMKLKNGYYCRWNKDLGKMEIFKKGKPVKFKEVPYDPREK